MKNKIINLYKPNNQKELPRRSDRTQFINFLKNHNLLDFYERCCICDWARFSVDLCHLVPHVENGFYEIENIIPLCPNHHRLLDYDKLKDYEYDAIQCFLWSMTNKVVPWDFYY